MSLFLQSKFCHSARLSMRFVTAKSALAVIAFAAISFVAPPLSAATLAYWQFENNYLDSSGLGHTLTATGTHSFVADKFPGAPGTFSLTNPSISYTQADGYIGPTNDFTVELFFKTSQSTGTPFLIGTMDHTYTDGDGTGGWVVLLNQGKVQFHTQDVSGTPAVDIISLISFADGSWHHIAATLSATNYMQLFVDGILQGQVQGELPPGARNSIRLGYSSSSTVSFPYNGSYDEVRISSGVLQPNQLLIATPVPLPSTVWLFGAAVAGFRTFRRHIPNYSSANGA